MSFLSSYVKKPSEMAWTDSAKYMMASIFSYHVEVPYLNDKGLQFKLTLDNDL